MHDKKGASLGGKQSTLEISRMKERYKVFIICIGMFLFPFSGLVLWQFFKMKFITLTQMNLSAIFILMPVSAFFGLVISMFLTRAYVSYKYEKRAQFSEDAELFGEGEKHIRGARIYKGVPKEILDAVKSQMAKSKKKLSPIFVGGAPFPYMLENRGMYIQGSAGSGKTQVIRQMIYDIRRRGGRDKLIIYDRKPEFLPCFWQPGDLVICPADKRHTKWSLFAEIDGQQDLDGVIKSLFPDMPGTQANDKFWIDSARGIFRAVLVFLLNYAERQGRKPTMKDLVLLLNNTISMPSSLKDVLWQDEGARFFASALTDADNERATVPTSAIGTLNTYVSSFMRPEVAEEGTFSIKKWLRDDSTEGQAIFLANPARYESNYRSYFTTILDLALRETISLTGDIDRRLWFFIDEFGSLMKLDSIVRLLAEGRSKGACTVLGTQDQAQIKQQYDKETETILNNCNSKVFGRIASFEEAEYVSKFIGEFEVEHDESEKVNYSLDSRGASTSMSEGAGSKRERRHAVLPTEVQTQADMSYIMQFGNLPFFKNRIDYYPWSNHEIIPEFISKETSAFDTKNIIINDVKKMFSIK